MSIKVNTYQLQSKSSHAATISSQLKDMVVGINRVYYSLDSEIKRRNNIDSSVKRIQQRLEKVQKDVNNISSLLTYAAEKYDTAENTVVSRASSIGAIGSVNANSDNDFGGANGAYTGNKLAKEIDVGAVVSAGESAIKDSEKNKVDSFLDTLQTALDVAGFVPGLGDLMDGINVAVSLFRGDILGAALSAIGLVPVIGSAVAVPLKSLLRAAGNADEIASALKMLAQIFGGLDKVVDGLKAMMNTVVDIIKNIPDKIDGLADNWLVKKALGNEGMESFAVLIAGLRGKMDEVVSKLDEVIESTNKAVISEGGSKVDAGLNEAADDFVGTLKGKEVKLPDVKTKDISYTKRDPVETQKLRSAFDSTERKKFLKSLAEDAEKLKKAGLSDADIARMKDGFNPKGWQVHHKLPLDDGGTNSLDNLILIKNDPYHKTITNVQRELTSNLTPGETSNIKWPIPEGDIYPPGN